MFPVEHLDAATRQAKRLATTDREAIKYILDLQYGKPITRLAQTLLFEERSWAVYTGPTLLHFSPGRVQAFQAIQGSG